MDDSVDLDRDRSSADSATDPGEPDDNVDDVIPTDFLPSTIAGAARWLADVISKAEISEPDAVIVHRDRIAVMMQYNTGRGANRDLAELIMYAGQLDSVSFTASVIQRNPAITLITARGTEPRRDGVRIDITGTVGLKLDRLETARIGTDVAVTRADLVRAART